MLVSGSYFPLLGRSAGARPPARPGDDRVVGESRVVVLSYSYWQKRFGLNPGVLNDAIIVNGQSLTIVGVAPRGFDGTTLGSQPEVFVPITLRALMEPGFKGFDNRRSYWAYVFGRLKPGVSIEQAKAGINAPYKAIINDVDAPLQTGMSEQTMKRFRARELGVAAGLRGQSSVSREAKGPADPAARRDRPRAAHRLCQHRQPAAGPGGISRRRRWRCGCRSARAAGSSSCNC